MELRKKTGVGMMDCKKALQETNGDMEAAINYLREKGISKAEKKEGRITSEGLVFAKSSEDEKTGCLLEINSETDFVAKNEEFQNFGKKMTELILDNNVKSIAELNNLKIDGKSVQETLKELIAKIGENISLRRFIKAEAPGFVSIYIHMGGKIGVLVGVEGEDNPENREKANDIAMHTAAMAPVYFDQSDVTEEDIKKEKEIMRKQLLEEGKPEKIIDKILIGKMRKFYEENCLLQQKFVKDDKITVLQYAGDMKVLFAHRFKVGEGLEKKEEDFAAEVAAQIKS